MVYSISNIVLVTNLILCLLILILGIVGYVKKKDTSLITIGIAFGLFGLSHLLTLLGFAQPLEGLLIGIRTAAYFIVIIAMIITLS